MQREDRDFLELLGYLYLQYGKADEARTIYSTIFEISDNPAPLHQLAYAYCLAQTGQYAVALHHLDGIDATSFHLKETSALLLLRGNILWHLGKDGEARRVLEKFLKTERRRNRKKPSPLSLIAQSATASFSTQSASGSEMAPDPARSSPVKNANQSLPAMAKSPVEMEPGQGGANPKKPEENGGGIWKKILRFIARKDIDREFSR